VTPEIFFRSPTEAMDEIIIEGQFEELSESKMQNLGPWTVEGTLTVCKKILDWRRRKTASFIRSFSGATKRGMAPGGF